LVVEMGDGQFPTPFSGERVEHAKQRHRVQSAGNGHQNCLTTFEPPAVLDALLNTLKQTGHATMLPHSPKRARLLRIIA
jgi:hypothetical protein